ncbi:MAG: signal recognition particle protein [Sandaracinaceae bacterium]|nr:signal recognition particle protein [Sandaracinaceae bacterium]
MFEALSKGFRAARNRLKGLQEIDEASLEPALRDVRLSLLEADVELGVVKRFLERVKGRVVGETIRTEIQSKGKKIKVGPAERFIQACYDELTRMMAGEGPAIQYLPRPNPTPILIVGLQGSGKTTTAAKLARLLTRQGRKVLLVAADLQRPGAVEQLQILGERVGVPVFTLPNTSPVEICTKALEQAKRIKRDTVIFDTAGRLAIDEALMKELEEIKEHTKAQNILLVVDAMIGQDAVRTASAFHQRLGLSGVIMTKLDGDARGGAALSIREVTGAPIRFIGTGEGLDRLEEFRPAGLAGRILGFGDVVGLMKDFEGVIDEEKAERDAERMLKGRFTLQDFLEQLRLIQSLGPIQELIEKLPFFADSVPEGFRIDERDIKRTEAIVSSMTKRERMEPELFFKEPSRIRRVAKGSGRSESEVVELLHRFQFMRQVMQEIGQQASWLSKIPGLRELAAAHRLQEAVRTTGFESNPMMAALADQLLEAAVAGGGTPSAKSSPRPSSRQIDREKRKKQRKMERESRKKSRR